jgi:hypothetical protein
MVRGMNRRWVLVAMLMGALAGAARAGGAHEHGVARLDVAVEPTRIVLLLDAPLDVLVGFERAPRTADEKALAAAVLTRLRDVGALLRIDPAAGCAPVRVDITAPELGAGRAAPGAAAGHADLGASYEFTCPRAEAAGFVELSLFEAFPRLQRLQVQTAGAKRQTHAMLRRPARRLELPR